MSLLNAELAGQAMERARLGQLDPRTLDFSYADDDQMLDRSQPLAYLNAGASGLRNVMRGLQFADVASTARIIDFGCGHGRVMRWLRAAFPNSEIVGIDVSESGVSFCAKTFRAIPLLSPIDLTAFPQVEPADIVWSGSLITHLKESAAETYLNLLIKLLRPRGVAIFSTHGREPLRWILERGFNYLQGQSQEPMLRGYYAFGYGFAPYQGTPDYGVSLIHPRWFLDRVCTRSDVQLAFYSEKAWDNYHDVVAITKLL
jgi:2-polyprenyl-3-methyl-5-hydroxy-6-metoxy-1,4-benzoquinol methylase